MEPTTNKKGTFITGWILSALAILFLLFDSFGKLAKPEAVLKGTIDLGYPESTITPIGIILLVCTLIYAFPRTAVLGAILLTGFLGGAVATNMRVESPLFSHILFPVYLAIIVWAGIYLRSQSLRNCLTGKNK